ncbi:MULTISPECIES: hypothetical protein [unclassified Nocardioides]|uniref:hypothetical protein n=1 Tax=unclassified Nocardioides TaxID=2615069 RepID=UPI0009EF9938|nr:MULTISPECIES: hypothetical protein [unclassified Nocardioides]GAW49902.1 uncharacterized protein PD653B2_2230 [Nocardioides sp. PD653-B2]GAW56005.1 uncharacterized protein PD653_3434 [Nocardioides sp. PD653]
MTYRLSRLLSTATAAYGGYALARPAHLWQALGADRRNREGLELLARTYGVRDLAISSLGVFGRSERTVRAAMLLRIAMDLGDAVLLSTQTDDEDVRRKVLAVTLGWAGLNALALAVDSKRAGG